MRIRIFKISALLVVVLFFVALIDLIPCTVAVVSGKATPDGRPLMWKNRDTSSLSNKMMYFRGEKYGFIGLVDAKDKKGRNVWAGINTEGFAIMNSASGDLADREEERMMGNGAFMKKALGECATVRDFERLLKSTQGKRSVGANFGVIDAEGDACFYETGSASHQKFDANDSRVAPFGYLIRTNYAFTAPQMYRGGGYIRFERASHLFETACAEGRISLEFIIREAARDLVNEKLRSYPFSDPRSNNPRLPLYINTNDTINRNSTASAVVFHGAPGREKAYLATMWILLGQPVCIAAVPLWASVSDIPYELGGGETAPLNDFSRALASYLYPDKRGHMRQYLSMTRMKHYQGEGVLSRLYRIDNQVITRTRRMLEEWESVRPSEKDMSDFEKEIASWVFKSMQKAFPNIEIAEKRQ
ncbi:MAG: hypothetical protein ACE5LC_06285 [Candidatus Aminicenantales bacterium]